MKERTEIARAIRDYYGNASSSDHHRYKSWEHCYRCFRSLGRQGLLADRHEAALHLGFYLASWGMYRGSSFLLQHAYTVHLGLVELIAGERFKDLWEIEVGASPTESSLVTRLSELVEEVREIYRPFAHQNGSGDPTDTLVTKVILGTFGSLPACDRFFIEGFKNEGHPYSALNRRFLERVLRFCDERRRELHTEQRRIQKLSGFHYPIMKLVDMYFWQVGFELSETARLSVRERLPRWVSGGGGAARKRGGA